MINKLKHMTHNPKELYTALDGKIITYPVMKKIKRGFIVYDKKEDSPIIFLQEQFNNNYFDTKKGCKDNALEFLTNNLKRCQDDIKKFNKL